MSNNDSSGVRVCIAYPSPEYLHHRFVTSLIKMLIYYGSRIGVTLANSVSSRIAFNRNKLVEQAKVDGATHILFIDADMEVPVNALERLLAHKKDIACATACSRVSADVDSIAGQMHGEPLEPMAQTPVGIELLELKRVGLPFMLIDMKVFDKIQKPYFAEPERGDGIVAEDQYFSEKVRAAGYQIWCDIPLSMEMGHVGSFVYKIKPV